MTTPLEQLSEAFPTSFSFYHLGEVELQPDSPELRPALPRMPQGVTTGLSDGIGFYMQGDLNAVFIVLLEKDLDRSIYSELGNILASKIATQLFVGHQMQISVSPPQSLSENQLANILNKSGPATFRKSYVHRYDNTLVYLETLFVPRPLEGIGNA